MIGSTGPGANTHDFPLLLKDLLGINLKIVSGYSLERRHHARGRAQGSRRPRRLLHVAAAVHRPQAGAADHARALHGSRASRTCRSTRASRPIRAPRRSWRCARRPKQVARPYVLPPDTPAGHRQGVCATRSPQTIKDPALRRRGARRRSSISSTRQATRRRRCCTKCCSQPKDIVDEFSQVHQVRRIISY